LIFIYLNLEFYQERVSGTPTQSCFFFQIITNWWLTSRGIITYHPDVIVGVRIASAPVEDLFFGFSMIVMVISQWIYWGRRGIQRN
jgi:lycopene cyclase domain-containing protein